MQPWVDVYLSPAPPGLETEFRALFTPGALNFLVELCLRFRDEVDELYAARLERRCAQKSKTRATPRFVGSRCADDNWKVAPVCKRLQNRHLDLGDVSPSDYARFSAALNCDVQGVQVDFDDGHCPTWRNQITGLHNIYRAVRGEMPNAPGPETGPILVFRPRAWNMFEHNASIAGREVPGPLFDYALILYHVAARLARCDAGPCFYLSKLEGAREARLWNDVFTWSEVQLGIPRGTIKACVLIENILSAFEMEGILYELREHSLGLNCGIWDYAASIIAKFGDSRDYLLPDRSKYVSMDKPFLAKYMDLVVRTCHRRGAHATGGMSAQLLPAEESCPRYRKAARSVVEAKLREIQAGVDGFMVYDLRLVGYMNELWSRCGQPGPNQILGYPGKSDLITEMDLLTLPLGGVTEEGLRHNIRVTLLFVYHWLCGQGVFALKGAIEDSATAEISRAQVWQWIRHGAAIETSDNKIVTRALVLQESTGIFEDLAKSYGRDDKSAKIKLAIALDVFLQIVNERDFPDFITTYLNDAYIFRKIQSTL